MLCSLVRSQLACCRSAVNTILTSSTSAHQQTSSIGQCFKQLHCTASSSSLTSRFIKTVASGSHLPRALGQTPGAISGKASWFAALKSQNLPSLAQGFAASTFATVSTAAALTSFKDMGIGGWLLVDLAIQLGGWAVSALLKTEKFYDMLGTGSFAVLAAGSLAVNGPITARKILVSAMVGVWAARLGSYLVARVHKVGKDSRFDEVKHQPGMFLFYWTMQAVWVGVTLSPVLIINTLQTTSPLRWLDYVGVGLWACGFLFESVADTQKDAFRSKPENKGRFINEGLWSVSRHPNYFGEMVVWWGMFLTCASGFTKPAHYVSVLSPVVVMLLLRYVSGVPILERQADARWGGQPDYEAYKSATPILVPNLTKLLSGGSNPAA